MELTFQSTEKQRRARRWVVRLAILVVLSAVTLALEQTAELAARAQVQNAADAAALAGAAYLMANPADASGTRATAIAFAELNPVRGSTPNLEPEDVHVDMDEGVVRVKVHAKVLPLPPPIAWLKVSAEATAQAMAVPSPGEPGWRTRKAKKLQLIY